MEVGLASKYNDGDPVSDLWFSFDEKHEHNFILSIASAQIQLNTDVVIIYDTEMRKFIKEKYGVEIQDLANKWIYLCWKCFAAVENLKKNSKCRAARYCGIKIHDSYSFYSQT